MKSIKFLFLLLLCPFLCQAQAFNLTLNTVAGVFQRTLTSAELSATIAPNSVIVQRIDLNQQEDISLNGNGNGSWCVSIRAVKSPNTPGDIVLEIDSYGSGAGNGATISSNGLSELLLTTTYQPLLEGTKNYKNILFSYHLDHAESTTSNITVDYEVFYQVVSGTCSF